MLLYSIQDSARLQYICSFIGKELFQEPIRITINIDEFITCNGPKIYYGAQQKQDGAFVICNTGLLFESGIRAQPLECFQMNGYKAFFKTPGGDFPFDVLAACFYLITRYEEYLPHDTDEYNRYAHPNSIAYRENFLHLPLVNIWLEDLRSALTSIWKDAGYKPGRFTFMPTYDIDIAYSYTGKGFRRNVGGMLRAVWKGEWRALNERMKVLIHQRRDPYDAYEWLDRIHRNLHMRPRYFFLLAKKQKGYDKNIAPSDPGYRALIKKHAAIYRLGIHPSWQTGDKPGLLKREIKVLENITGESISLSRQHYIRLHLPETYRALVLAGIQKDFSMGYGSINGFRASVASSFNWYDLEKEETTPLLVYPFCFMDANSFYEQKSSPAGALEELRQYYKVIRKNNGLMVIIWHNHFLGTDPLFTGWRESYEAFLTEISMETRE